MAKSPASQAVAPFLAVVQHTFIPEDIPLVVAYVTDEAHLFQMLEILGSTGYEVSQRYDKSRESWSVCIKGADRDCTNAGKWMYGNGETLNLAYCSALYKHFQVFKQGEWRGSEAKGSSILS